MNKGSSRTPDAQLVQSINYKPNLLNQLKL